MNELDPNTNKLLSEISEAMRLTLKPFIGSPVSHAVVDQIRETVLTMIDEVVKKSDNIRAKDWEKWVTVKLDPENQNRILVQLNDAYNAPTWLYLIFLTFSGNEAI